MRDFTGRSEDRESCEGRIGLFAAPAARTRESGRGSEDEGAQDSWAAAPTQNCSLAVLPNSRPPCEKISLWVDFADERRGEDGEEAIRRG
jgi:hypothetical protein